MSEKEKYIIYIGKQPVEVSKEVYDVYNKGERKERYFSVDLKSERVKKDCRSGTRITIPSREDSYERLLETEKQFSSDSDSIEDVVMKSVMLEHLNMALRTLTEEERWLIYELFYKQRTERELCAEMQIGKTTLHKRKEKLLSKLHKLLEEN